MSMSNSNAATYQQQVRAALICTALGTTALTALTAAPDAAYAACIAAGPANTFNVNNTAFPLNLTANCPAPGAANSVTVLPGTTVTNAGGNGITSGALQWDINNQGTIIPLGGNGIEYNAANGVVTNSGTINGNTSVSFSGGGNSTFTNEVGGVANSNLGTTVNLGGTGTVTNHGTINSTGFGSGINIVGAGGVVNNTGTITVANALGVVSFGGGTVTNAQGASITSSTGSVQFTNIGGTFINAGTVTSNLTATAFIGSGGDDIVELQPTGIFNGSVFGNGGNDTLRFGGNGAGTFNLAEIDTGTDTLKYQRFEIFNVTGGEWTFNNTTTVPFAINGGTVKGTGTFGGLTANAGGTLAPGNSIGTLNVAGNVVFAPGSTYQVEINENGTSDLIAATGTATIGGGTVNVLPEPGLYANPLTYTIITAGGGVAGTFNNVTIANNFAFLNPTLIYNANNVQLSIGAGAAFSAAARTRNQRSTAAVLDGLAGTATGTLQRALNNLTIQTVPGALAGFESLNGEIHVAGASAALLNINHVADTMRRGDGVFAHRSATQSAHTGGTLQFAQATLGRSANDAAEILVSANPGAAAHNLAGNGDTPWTYWSTALGSEGLIDSDSNGRKTEHTQIGFAAGGEYRLTDATSLGVSVAYLNNDADLGSQDMDRSTYVLGATGRHASPLGLDIEASIGYGYQDIETSRSIAIGAFGATANADYNAHTGFASFEASTTRTAGQVVFRPFVGATYVYSDVDGFTETGAGTAGLTNDGETYSSLISRIGLQLSTEFTVADRPVVPTASLAWARELGDVSQSSDFAFVSGGGSFDTWATERGRNSAELGFGLASLICDGVSAHLGYQGTYSGQDRDTALTAGVRVAW